MKENTKNVFNKILTVVVILLAALCIFLAVRIIGGNDTSIFGYQVYHILTGSMEPTIPTGSTVITKKVDPYTLKEGDVITFTSRDAEIYGNSNTHRIIGIDDSSGERKFITKGDANGRADAIEVAIPDIKGKVVFHANFRAFSAFLDFMRTGYGFVTVICFPFLFIFWQISMKLKREIKEYSEETARLEAESELEKDRHAELERLKEIEKAKLIEEMKRKQSEEDNKEDNQENREDNKEENQKANRVDNTLGKES